MLLTEEQKAANLAVTGNSEVSPVLDHLPDGPRTFRDEELETLLSQPDQADEPDPEA